MRDTIRSRDTIMTKAHRATVNVMVKGCIVSFRNLYGGRTKDWARY